MPWPEPEPPPMTPPERARAFFARLGCIGVLGLLTGLLVIAYAARDWWPFRLVIAP